MYYIEDKEFGKVYISVRNNMRNITMRWKGGKLFVNVPPETSSSHLETVLGEMRPKLRKMQSSSDISYHIGQKIQCYGFVITIGQQDKIPDKIVFSNSANEVIANVPTGIDIDEYNTKIWISKALKVVAHHRAAAALIPFAQSISARLGVAPERFEIGRGLRKLGHCTPKKVIQLSENLVFLPADLIEYIVCHELAHLTHMNHSPQFHALVDKYLIGREKALERKLRAFNWPVIR